MSPETRTHVERIGPTLVIRVDRPLARNAVDPQMAAELEDAVEQAARTEEVRAVVLTGAGADAFIAGADLRFLRSASDADAFAFLDQVRGVATMLATMPKLTIAAVNGACRGGGAELALACDIRIADKSASFSFRHARMGLCTAWGGTERLVALVGRGQASLLLLTAEVIDATRALDLGLVEEIVDSGHALPRALELARLAADSPARTQAALKRCIAHAGSADADDVEQQELAATWHAGSWRAAIDAFLAERGTKT